MPILLNKTDPDSPNARFEKRSPLLIGTGADADLRLEARGVSSSHCWIERHADGFHLVDLNTTNGSYVNGKQVKDTLLKPGDHIRLGKVELEFQLTEAEEEELETSLTKHDEPSQLVRVESELAPPGAGAGTAVDFGRRCQQCGAPMLPQANFCPRCGLPTTAVARPMEQFVHPVEGPSIRGPGILPMLALICGLVGPLLLGVGWLLGIILGLMALGIIRRTGGFERDRRQAMWGVGAGFAWIVVIFVVGGIWWLSSTAADRQAKLEKEIGENEQSALSELSNLARAEKFAKTTLFADANHNNIGEYVKLDQLDKLESPFVNHALAAKPVTHGYRFVVREASEDHFLAVAEPQRQGRTGKRTFAVDQTGVLRGEVVGKARSVAQLPPLQMPNAFEGVDDEIAEDALAVAKNLARSGDYEKTRAVLDDLRQHYILTKAAKQLGDLEKTVDPFLIEARADGKFQAAQTAQQRGDLLLAIALLRDIETNYGTFSKIHDATKQREQLELQFAQSQEDKAKALFDKAEALERDGKVAEAETIYFQIEKGYPNTDWAKQVMEVKPALHKQLREKQVEGWLQQLASLSPETDYVQILNLIQQLRRNYSDTDAYREATDAKGELQSLAVLEQKALAQRLKVDAMKQVQAGQSRRALTTLEKAISEKPDLAVYLRETLWDLYPRVAEQLLAEHDASGAMALYESFLKLNPPEGKLNRQFFAQLSYQVGQSDLVGGKPEAALPRLQQAEAVFRSDPDFNAVYGRTLCRLAKYEEAIGRFDAAASAVEAAVHGGTERPGTAATTSNSLATTLYFWRAWTWLHWAEQLEEQVRESAELPSLSQVQSEVDRARSDRNAANAARAAKTSPASTNQPAPAATNITITIEQPATPPEEGGATTNVFETLLSGSLELVSDIESARMELAKQELGSRGKGEKTDAVSFKKAQTIQQFSARISKLRQLLFGEREHQRTTGENLQHLLDAYAKAQADLEKGAKINESKNTLLAQNARLVIPKIAERGQLYRSIVPSLIRVRGEDLTLAEGSLDLADQAVKNLQWNLKGGLSISKAVEESFRRIGSRKALDEAVAAFHRYDEKKLDLAELWRRNSLPEP